MRWIVDGFVEVGGVWLVVVLVVGRDDVVDVVIDVMERKCGEMDWLDEVFGGVDLVV